MFWDENLAFLELFWAGTCFNVFRIVLDRSVIEIKSLGPGCSKPKMLLVNVFIKISNVNISNKPIIFVEKNEKLLHVCTCKSFLIFSTKNISVYLVAKS